MSSQRKVAVISGAARGIGEALVKAYRERDYRVVSVARSAQAPNDPDIAAVAGDLADATTARQAIDEATARFGRVDTLVNNAGLFVAKPLTQYTEADYRAVMGVNVAGFFRVTRRALLEMEKQGGGHVVQITTTLVDHAMAMVPSALASLSKGGLVAATRSLAIEYARRGIRVNAVSPGIIRTPMHPAEATRRSTPCIPSATWATSPTSSARSSIWNPLRSSPQRSCMSMAARAPATRRRGGLSASNTPRRRWNVPISAGRASRARRQR